MLNYANYADNMPFMLYAPAMLLCQFLCWHNPLTPTSRLGLNPSSLVTLPLAPISMLCLYQAKFGELADVYRSTTGTGLL